MLRIAICDNGETCQKALRALIPLLPHGFVKAHRGYLVNLRHIRHIESRDVVMESGERIPISKGLYRRVLDQHTTYISTIIEDLL